MTRSWVKSMISSATTRFSPTVRDTSTTRDRSPFTRDICHTDRPVDRLDFPYLKFGRRRGDRRDGEVRRGADRTRRLRHGRRDDPVDHRIARIRRRPRESSAGGDRAHGARGTRRRGTAPAPARTEVENYVFEEGPRCILDAGDEPVAPDRARPNLFSGPNRSLRHLPPHVPARRRRRRARCARCGSTASTGSSTT